MSCNSPQSTRAYKIHLFGYVLDITTVVSSDVGAMVVTTDNFEGQSIHTRVPRGI